MAAPPGRPAGRAELPPVLRRLRDLPAWLVHVHGGHRLGGAGQRGQRHRRGVRVRGRRGPPGAAARVRRRGRGPPRTAPGDAAADVLRCAAQAGLAAALFAGRPAIWLFVLLAWLEGSGEAFFRPALGALTVEIAPRDQLGNANALYGLATSATRVGGPALGGVLVAFAGPAVVVAADAASYLASVLALSLLRMPRTEQAGPGGRARRTLFSDMAEGWSDFRSRSWLWVVTVQLAFFNLITWAPWMLLGPVEGHSYLGGAAVWGTIMAVQGAGAVVAGLASLGRRPRRPMVIATAGTLCYALPDIPLALPAGGGAGGVVAGLAPVARRPRRPMVIAPAGTFCYALPDIPMALHAAAGWVGAAAFACGAGAALSSTFFGTALQQQVPADRLARVNSLTLFPAYGVGVIGYAIDGPLASVLGAPVVFGVGAAYGLLSSAAVLALPSVRGLRWRDQAPASAPRQGPAGLGPSRLGPSRLGPAGGAAKGGERGQPRDHGDDDRDRERPAGVQTA